VFEVDLPESLDLLPETARVTAKTVDDEIEKPVEVVVTRQLGGLALVDSRTLGHVDQDEGVG